MSIFGRKSNHRILFVFFIIICLVSFLIPTASAADFDKEEIPEPAQQIVTSDYVTIGLYDIGQSAIGEARVGPGDLRTIFFKGFVEQVSWGPAKNVNQVIVFLHVEIDEPGWSAMANPPMISFQYISRVNVVQTRDFSVSVLAPFRAAYRDEPLSVKVTGDWITAPISTGGVANADAAEVKVMVKEFPDLLLDSLDIMIQTSPGQSTDFELQIHNRGNNYDDFIVEFVNDETLENAGWAIELREPSVIEDIAPWSYKNVTIRVHSPRKFTPWKNQVTEIIVKVISDSSIGSHYEKFGEKDLSFFLYERGVYLPPEQTICSVTGLIILIGIVVWWRKRKYREFDRPKKRGKKKELDGEVEVEPEDEK